MDTAVWIVGLVIGIPVMGLIAIPIVAILRGWWLKARELKVEEERIQMEERVRTDELNAKILRMDDLGISPMDISALADEVRRLREEVAQLKSDLNNRVG